MRHNEGQHLCGCYVRRDGTRKYLPLVQFDAHASIFSMTSRTTLTQSFVNPYQERPLDEVRYDFPLYDGVSVVALTCSVGSRIIKGVVKGREEAALDYEKATREGQFAALLEQSFRASDIFTIMVGNIPAGEKIQVEIVYLGELKHDAEVDGLRFTIPTYIAPRYGLLRTTGVFLEPVNAPARRLSIKIDVDMGKSRAIRSIQSPSHLLSVEIGKTSTTTAEAEPSLSMASANLALETTELDKDFVVQVVATDLGNPTAVLESHPSIPDQCALAATLVPRFNIPAGSPEIVFVCDRSGSMTTQMPGLKEALQIFLKSLPLGIKFNICSFASDYLFLWSESASYNQATLDEAVHFVSCLRARGGTQMHEPLRETFGRRYSDLDLEVFLLTDGRVYEENKLFELIRNEVQESKGAVRVFSLGIGQEVSHSLVEGVARAGNGFAQMVSTNEKMSKKVVRMLKGALTPHIHDYTLELKYDKGLEAQEDAFISMMEVDEDFELIENATEGSVAESDSTATAAGSANEATERHDAAVKEPISLFDPTIQDDGAAPMEASFKSRRHVRRELPSVIIPRHLQAPFKNPPLIPFDRTTVYVLLSGGSPRHQPTAVLLKGTSPHGPLELEIPVAKLAESGTTIHQLAARKVVKELEEGRGWLYDARVESGELLRENFPGRFSDMVEREAVRLGEEYQVAGKWCSFVGVQEGGSESQPLPEIQIVNADDASARSALQAGGGRERRGILHRKNIKRLQQPPAEPLSPEAQRPDPEISRAARESLSSVPLVADRSFRAMAGMGSFATAPEARSGPALSRMATGHQSRLANPPQARRAVPESLPLSSGNGMGELQPRGTPAPSAQPGPDAGSLESANRLSALAALQAFDGSWAWTEALEAVVGLSQERVAHLLGRLEQCQRREDILATVCAVTFLRKKLPDEEETWDMLVAKAEAWLAMQTGSDSSELHVLFAAELSES